jgi:hypothetical protein
VTRRLYRISAQAALAASMAVPAPTLARAAPAVVMPSGNASAHALGFGAVGGPVTMVDADHPLPVGGRADGLVLVSANAPLQPQAAYGGTYVLSATCSTWAPNGLTVRSRGPDGSTMLPVHQFSADGSVEIGMGAGAVVDAVVAGTAGCNLTLSREPQS